MYPIIGCKDGFARICVLAQRQWRGMFDLLPLPQTYAAWPVWSDSTMQDIRFQPMPKKAAVLSMRLTSRNTRGRKASESSAWRLRRTVVSVSAPPTR